MYKAYSRCMLRMPLQQKAFMSQKFEDIIVDDVFKEQLVVGSPSLFRSLRNLNRFNDKKKNNIKISVQSYAKRASFRTTPFGCFSGINISNLSDSFGNCSEIKNFKVRKVATVDYDWLLSLVREYELKNVDKVSYKMNSGLFLKGDRAFLPYSLDKKSEINVKFVVPLRVIYRNCKREFKSYLQLVSAIQEEGYNDVPMEVFPSFFKELLKNNIIISKLRPPICNEDPLQYVLRELDSDSLLREQLFNLKKKIDFYNESALGDGTELLLEIISYMKSLHKMENGDNFLKIDSYLDFDRDFGIFSEKSIDKINSLANMMSLMNQNLKKEGGLKESFDEFSLKFLDKYGENCNVPLTEVLDSEKGIGFPDCYNSELDENIMLNDPIMLLFEKKYEKALMNNEKIEFSIDELQFSTKDNFHTSESFELNFRISKIDNNQKLYLGSNIGSGQAGRSFGRFYHLNSEVKRTLKELDLKGTNVELSFVPQQARIANVMENYSVESKNMSLFTSSWDISNEILLEDVMLKCSDGNLYLSDKNTGEILNFTMKNMLNTKSQGKIVRFLIDVSEYVYGFSSLSVYPWDMFLKEHIYVPEIVFNGITISSEQWGLFEIRNSILNKNTFHEKKKIFKEFIEEYDIPSSVIFKYADNEIPMNLLEDLDLKILFKNLKKYPFSVIRVPDEGESIFKETLGDYNVEVVVPFINVNNTFFKDNQLYENHVDEYMTPFEDWVYMKLYGPRERQEELLISLKKFIGNLNSPRYKFFYMRYRDGKDHVRLRFKSSSSQENFELYQKLNHQVFSTLLKIGVINNIDISTYFPESNRYGGPKAIRYAENIFCKESAIYVNNCLNLSYDEKLLLASFMILNYVEKFYNDTDNMMIFLKNNYTNKFKKEFKNLSLDYSIEYNKYREGLPSEFDKYAYLSCLTEEINNYLKNKAYLEKYNSFENILGSFIHLSMNRLQGIDREFEEKAYCFAFYIFNAQKYLRGDN